ncbi:MAG: beta-ketoacyl synthase chain length factor [Methylophilus sp.]|uniref:beta-ketoacyl synthase chain length factor n=1 Tax=Methylophilus sp. TaxID=29541 RepID=UPI003FA0E32D
MMTFSKHNNNSEQVVPGDNIVLPVAKWASWQQGAQAASPDVSFMELSIRRKLGLLTKMCLHVANECAGYDAQVRVVFASRHGDLTRTTAMLQEIVSAEPLSPTAFSMAVLNASTGVYSMQAKNIWPSTAISAGAHTFAMGLLEAALQWQSQPEQPVLYLYAEDAPPDFYHTDDAGTFVPHAVGILLSGASPACTLKLATQAAASSDVPPTLPMSLAWVESMQQGQAATWQGDGRAWQWEFAHAAH